MKKLILLFCFMFGMGILMPISAGAYDVNVKVESKTTKKTDAPAPQPKRVAKKKKKPLPFGISIVGQNPATIFQGSAFVDEGAVANDPVDGKFAASVLRQNVNAGAVGTYFITYVAGNSRGKVVNATRTVVVESPPPSPSPTAVVKTTPSPTAVPKATSTPKPASEPKKFSERILQIGLEEHALNSVGFDPLPMGFGITPNWNVGQRVSMQVAFIRQLALKASYDFGKMGMEAKTYGSSLDSVYIANQAVAELKVYPLDSVPGFLPYLGLGAAYAQISGNYSVGGFQFPRTGDGWTWVVDLGAEFPVGDWLAFSADYQLENIPVVTSIPGVGDLSTSLTGSLQFGLVARPF